MYNILKECELPCEKIKVKRSGSGWYGSSSIGYNETDIAYKEVQNNFLNKALKRLMRKYKCTTPFVIGASIDADFEIIPGFDKIVFNTMLDVLSDKDLEAIVIIGMLHSKETNMYYLMKRFVKVILRSSSFKKILFSK